LNLADGELSEQFQFHNCILVHNATISVIVHLKLGANEISLT